MVQNGFNMCPSGSNMQQHVRNMDRTAPLWTNMDPICTKVDAIWTQYGPQWNQYGSTMNQNGPHPRGHDPQSLFLINIHPRPPYNVVTGRRLDSVRDVLAKVHHFGLLLLTPLEPKWGPLTYFCISRETSFDFCGREKQKMQHVPSTFDQP